MPTKKLTIDELVAFRNRIANEATPRIAGCTVPLFGLQDGAPIQNGSGILFAIAEKHFLFSAAHVLDYCTIHRFPYFIGAARDGERPIALSGLPVHCSSVPTTRSETDAHMRDDDPLDIGVCELTQEVVNRMAPDRLFLRTQDLASPRQQQGIYLVTGYPFVWSELDRDAKTVYSEAFRHISQLHRGVIEDRDMDRDILLSYPTAGEDPTGATVEMPLPDGLSGCGIWRLAVPDRPVEHWNVEDVKLVAIEHRWRSKNRYLVGTSVMYALRIIYENYEKLRPAMKLQCARLDIAWPV